MIGHYSNPAGLDARGVTGNVGKVSTVERKPEGAPRDAVVLIRRTLKISCETMERAEKSVAGLVRRAKVGKP